MSQSHSLYDTLVFRHAKWVLLFFILIAGALAPYAKEFRLDASSDSLVLENDASLKYFRKVVSNYAGDELLLVTYKPDGDLFAQDTLDDLSALREKLLKLDLVKSIISILDAPLTQSPPVTLAELATNPQTLRDARTNIALAKKEFTDSALYSDLLVSDDLSTTAIVMSLAGDAEVSALLDKRNALREKRAEGGLSKAEAIELETITKEHQIKADAAQARQAAMIAEVRGIMQEHEANAKLFLGGLPMIVADSVAYINADVMTFGLAALAVIVLILTIAFRQFGWIVMPLINCAVTGFMIVCLLGLLNWPISVVSSNFLSLLLIITLSLNIHLIVRYRELAKLHPEHDQTALLSSTVRSKFIPCLYTALTTIVAFASLIVSGIRPVIDFGWIMCLGIVVAFITTFTLFPALAVWMRPRAVEHNRDALSKLILNGAQTMHQRGVFVSLFFTIITVAAVYGIANLTVENRFIDYFKPETEIYQGMVEIDEQLGGTTPMDIILDAPADFLAAKSVAVSAPAEAEEDDFEDDDFFDEFEDEVGDNIVISSYWFNKQGLDKLKDIQRSLDAIPSTGKVMSLATSMSVFEGLRDQGPMDNIDLSFMLTVLSDDNKKTLIDPYLSEDGNQTHINIRVFETFRGLDRDQLISDIRTMLIEEHGLQDEQINISGMVVLYNNMLNSLFNSQIMTLGTVFVVIFLMFIVLFRSVKLALISIIPNVFSAAVVLGIMGIFSIPLDLMTITIAAISVGIAVDNSIHFVHRYRDEMGERADNRAAINSATINVGQAMFYTTLVITAGFLIMVFSNFVPTMYFGVLTGIAMVTALIANLVMLPMLVAAIKPIADA